MAKRNHNFETPSNKKHKLNDDIEALWGEDLDENAVDVCIKLSQAYEEKVCSELNSSALPSYTSFKKPDELFASTQLNAQPSHSRASEPAAFPVGHSDLQRKYEEKEGEVAILRLQLKDLNKNHSLEQHKIENDWKQKLKCAEKEVQSIKSELEFKKLEIANLKQKLSAVAKQALPCSNNDTLLDNRTFVRKQSNKDIKEPSQPSPIDCTLYGSSVTAFPLKDVLGDSFLDIPKREKHTIHYNVINPCRNAIPYLQSRTVTSKTIVEEDAFEIQLVMPYVYMLVNSSEVELNSRKCINEVIWVTYELLLRLNKLFTTLERHLRKDDLLAADSNYLSSGGDSFCQSNDYKDAEVGIKAGTMLKFLSKLLLHHDYHKKKYFWEQMLIKCPECLINTIKTESKSEITGKMFLQQIIDAVRWIGKLRKSDITSKFLSTSLDFFITLCRRACFDSISDMLCDFTKEIIFLRPSKEILFKLTYLLKEGSHVPSFLEYLFNKSQSNCSSTKGVVYFNNDACRLYIFALQFENVSIKTEVLPTDVIFNLLSFIYNTYNSALWIHYDSVMACDCMAQLYKLVMDTMFKTMENYFKDMKHKKRKSEYQNFFTNNIVNKILNLMAFHGCELIEKYITVLAEYKEMENVLETEELNDGDSTNIGEDVPEIDSALFVDW